MYDAIIAEVDTDVSDEEAAQRTFSYVEVSKDTSDDDSTADTETEGEASDEASEDDSDEAAAQLQEKMEAYAALAAHDFDGTAETYDYTVSTASYGSAEDEDAAFDTAVLEAADSLKEGEISGLIETDDNYYVIRLDSEFDEEATETKKESIISERKSDQYNSVLDGYKEDVTWEVNEDNWATVTFDKLFTLTDESAETESTEVSDYSE
jgi:foldase protein PrsA